MEAQELDQDIECPICEGDGVDPVKVTCDQCNGTGSVPDHIHDDQICDECEGIGEVATVCRRCEGNEYINRFGPADPSDEYGGEVVILTEKVSPNNSLHVQSIAISNKEIGGFNERYGEATINDDQRVSRYPPDIRDQLLNSWGDNADRGSKYSLPSGEVRRNDFRGSTWPNPDLDIQDIILWMESRGDIFTSKIFERIKDERGW